MKRHLVWLLLLIFLGFLATDAVARTGARRSTIRVYGTTGGAAGDLDAVECEDIRGDDAATTDPLRDDDVAWGIITTAGAHPQIYFWAFDEDVDDDNCTGANEPWDCCTGSETGTCPEILDTCFTDVFSFSIRTQDVGTSIGLGLRTLIWNQMKNDILTGVNDGTFD